MSARQPFDPIHSARAGAVFLGLSARKGLGPGMRGLDRGPPAAGPVCTGSSPPGWPRASGLPKPAAGRRTGAAAAALRTQARETGSRARNGGRLTSPPNARAVPTRRRLNQEGKLSIASRIQARRAIHSCAARSLGTGTWAGPRRWHLGRPGLWARAGPPAMNRFDANACRVEERHNDMPARRSIRQLALRDSERTSSLARA